MDFQYFYSNTSFLDDWDTDRIKLLKFIETDNKIKEKNIKAVIKEISTTCPNEST